ncbi:hypothetical protein [Kitasatospora sp. NPDC001095]
MTHHPPPMSSAPPPTSAVPPLTVGHAPDDDRSPEQLVAAGVLRHHPDPRPHPTLGHSPIDYVTTELWAELTALAIAPTAAETTATALLNSIADRAVDAALAPGNERAPRDDLYVTDPAHIGPHRRAVWFQRSGPRGPRDPHNLLTPLDPLGGFTPRGPITASFAPREP